MENSVFGDVIYAYSRAQAIEDGVLVDVSETAREAGFKFPVAVTRTLWNGYITPLEESRKWGQSESGRLWDVVYMLMQETRRMKKPTDTLYVQVYFIMKEKQKRLVTLKSICGPGDDGEPVITIMLPEED